MGVDEQTVAAIKREMSLRSPEERRAAVRRICQEIWEAWSERTHSQPLALVQARTLDKRGFPVQSAALSRRLEQRIGDDTSGTVQAEWLLNHLLEQTFKGSKGHRSLYEFYTDYLFLRSSLPRETVPKKDMHALGARHGLGHTATYHARRRAEDILADVLLHGGQPPPTEPGA